ncbi:hypothetical protein Prudu_017259 [Prunus dulcis]|uniref:Transposable element protein n=1 Tax=Prunus dulcis TaxID=3755 RepID=A0A4Y1RPW8_PRUDU|nr:hypothetical protein Prudu_017259 [Prunus dulcis]
MRNTRILDCKPVDTLIVHNHHLGVYPNQVPTYKERYQSQFMHSPSEDHMNAVIRILRYLKSAPGKGLMFSKHGHLNIDGYTDADWVGSITNRKSTSSYFTFVGDRHYIKQKLEAKVIQFPFLKSEDQLVDILTKTISNKAFHNLLDQLSIGDIYAPT